MRTSSVLENFDLSNAFDQTYYEKLLNNINDTFIDCIKKRFDDKNLTEIILLHDLIASNELNLDKINLEQDLKKYEKIFNFETLSSELRLWQSYKLNKQKADLNLNNFSSICLHFNINNLKEIFPQIFEAIRLYLSIPISSAEAERSFSCLKRLKNWLRNRASQELISSSALISLELENINDLDYDAIIDEFASNKVDRKMQLV